MGAVSDSLIARFAGDWQRLAPAGPVGLAVSGGPDSVALLLLMHEVAPRNFAVATVDHGLRRESAREAAMVARLCAERGISHQTLTISLARGSAVQARARTARYAAMGDWARANALPAIVTAHHADDQAETMAMRLNRAAGLRGLAGMRPIAPVPECPDLTLLRPLLSWRRSDLAEVVQQTGIAPADDPSNRDHTYERVRLRDAMTSTDAFNPSGFAASAAYLAEADTALEWMVERLWQDVIVTSEGFTWNAPTGLPRALSLRMLERLLTEFGSAAPRGPDLARWLDTLLCGGVATLGAVKADARAGPWRFSRVPARKT
ncbi:MAG: tRNA lysidine(34) synthetase TilS [Pseudomonadota bacterium]